MPTHNTQHTTQNERCLPSEIERKWEHIYSENSISGSFLIKLSAVFALHIYRAALVQEATFNSSHKNVVELIDKPPANALEI